MYLERSQASGGVWSAIDNGRRPAPGDQFSPAAPRTADALLRTRRFREERAASDIRFSSSTIYLITWRRRTRTSPPVCGVAR
jgi:hypothetical protein